MRKKEDSMMFWCKLTIKGSTTKVFGEKSLWCYKKGILNVLYRNMRSDTKFEKEYRKHGIIRKTGKKLYRKHELEKRKINRKHIFKK